MRTQIIFTVFTIMMFGAVANAQTHVKAFDGIGFAPLLPAGSLSTSSTGVPVLNLIAGQPIRVHIRTGDGMDDVIVGAGSFGHVKTTAIPCGNVPSTSVRKAGDDRRQDYLTLTLTEVMVSATERTWRNTCRLLTVELRDGSKYIGKIRFR